MMKAVAYYRMSTDRQETSIPDQRREVERFAEENGFNIIRDYVDEGISGDATEKRKGFLKLRDDAAKRGDFETILCWDQDRFGRFDSLDAGYWIKPIRDAGVSLATVAQGAINWNDFSGRVLYGIQQEGKHQFLRDLSRNCTRALKQKALAGQLASGQTPYGFAREYSTLAGEVVAVVPRGERTQTRAKGLNVWLVAGNPLEVETVRWIFETYAEKRVSMTYVRDQLNERKVPSPGHGLWNINNVRDVLGNLKYVGDMVYGERISGKYYSVTGGEQSRNGSGRRRFRRQARENWIVVPDVHEPLISRKLFDRVQKRRANRKKYAPKMGQKGRLYILSGLLRCARCGSRLSGRVQNGRTVYICQSYVRYGRASECRCCSVRQDGLLEILTDLLKSRLRGGRNVEALRELLRERFVERSKPKSGESVEALRARVAELDAMIARAAERLLAAPENLMDVLSPQLDSWRSERDTLGKRVAELSRPRENRRKLDAEIDSTVERIVQMTDELDTAEPVRLAELMQRFVDRIVVTFVERPIAGKRRLWWRVDKAEVWLKAFESEDGEAVESSCVTIPGESFNGGRFRYGIDRETHRSTERLATDAEAKRLLKHCSRPLQLLYRAARKLKRRAIHLAELDIADVDLERGVVRLPGGQDIEAAIDPELRSILLEAIGERKEGPLFRGPRGSRYARSSLNRQWKVARDAAGITGCVVM